MGDSYISFLEGNFQFLVIDDEEVDISSAVECFPRCEYCVRFENTTAFKMFEPDFWGTYFRSTAFGGNSDRLTKLTEPKYYRNPVLNCNRVSIAKAGSVYSPWKNMSYNMVLKKLNRQINKPINFYVNDSSYLYDQLLVYKNHLVKTTADMVSKQIDSQLDLVNVYHCNDYPCLMVSIPRLQRLSKKMKSPDGKSRKEEISGETNSLVSIICAHFVPICNHLAEQNGVPIEMVLRSSFGHNGPSVTETSSSFRVNIGIVPFEYCNVISAAIFQLYECFLKPLFGLNLKLMIEPEDIERHNDQVNSYNKTKSKGEKFNVEEWFLDEPLLNILCKIGDSKRSKVSLQLSRMNKYMDFLAHLVSDELSFNALSDPTYSPNFSLPLSKLLKCLVYRVDRLSSGNTSVPQAIARMQIPFYQRSLQSFGMSTENIKSDEMFWNIILNISKQLDSSSLSSSLEFRSVKGLYSKLERANVEFVARSFSLAAEDGYGSDSDYEADIEHMPGSLPNRGAQLLYCRKITVATGIRAINLAHFIALYVSRLFKCKPHVDCTYMYYETSLVIRSITSMTAIFGDKEQVLGSNCIKYIDLNHCATFGVDEVTFDEMAVNPFDVLIFDYTSANTSKIREAIKTYIGRVSVIILLSSGLKNEQVGADINPYGTVRIITKELGLLNELDSVAKASVSSEVLPKNLHHIRKAYKAIGAVVTNKAIFTCNYHCHYTYRNHKLNNDMFKLLSQSTDSLNVIMNLAKNDDLREKVCIPLFKSGLENVILTCLQTEFNLTVIEHLVPDLCLLADTYSMSCSINNLNLSELTKLVDLFSSKPDCIERLVDKYKYDLSFLSWNADKFILLTSSSVESIWDDFHSENKVDLEDLADCYDIDSDLVESIVSFYNFNLSDQALTPTLLFLHDDFNSLFQRIFHKKTDLADNPFSFYDPDFSYENELSLIYMTNLKESEDWDGLSNDGLYNLY